MYSLLPAQNVKNLVANYRGRLFAVFAFFVSFMLVLGVLSLIPAYVAVNGYYKEAENQTKSAETERKLPEAQDVGQKVIAAQALVRALDTVNAAFLPSYVVNKISAVRSKGITIKAFEMAKSSDGTTLDLLIRGGASTRETLVDFKKNLLSLPGVTKVDLPSSDLTKSKDLVYSLKIAITLSLFK